jgi:hypothetical protein
MVLGSTAAFAQSGAQSASPPSITDYANYPLALNPPIIPAGCTTQGPGILTGTQYSMNGGAPVGDLSALGQIPANASITMTWSGYAQNCEGIGVSLSRKIAQQVGFSEADNQYLNAWSYCGPQGNPCTGTLTLDLSQAAPVACYQMDANVGPPLQIVGPGGAFYSINGKFNTLLSANNGGAEPCAPAPCPVPGSPPDMPASSAACQDLQATTTSTAAPTTAPASTSPPVTTSGPGQVAGTSTSTAPCGPNQERDAASGQCVAVLAGGAALPFTGSRSSEMAGLGAIVLGAGLLALVVSRHFRRNPLH